MHRGRSLLVLITILSGVVAPKPTDVFELELDEAWTALDPTAILEQGPIDPFDPLSVEYPEPRLAELDPLPVCASAARKRASSAISMYSASLATPVGAAFA